MQLHSPPLEILYLMPKSPLGPPGLWLAVRIMPPTAFILRITQETAGVDMMPFWPITRWPICRREHKHKRINAHRHVQIYRFWSRLYTFCLAMVNWHFFETKAWLVSQRPIPLWLFIPDCFCMLAAQSISCHWVTLKIRVQAMWPLSTGQSPL